MLNHFQQITSILNLDFISSQAGQGYRQASMEGCAWCPPLMEPGSPHLGALLLPARSALALPKAEHPSKTLREGGWWWWLGLPAYQYSGWSLRNSTGIF